VGRNIASSRAASRKDVDPGWRWMRQDWTWDVPAHSRCSRTPWPPPAPSSRSRSPCQQPWFLRAKARSRRPSRETFRLSASSPASCAPGFPASTGPCPGGRTSRCGCPPTLPKPVGRLWDGSTIGNSIGRITLTIPAIIADAWGVRDRAGRGQYCCLSCFANPVRFSCGARCQKKNNCQQLD